MPSVPETTLNTKSYQLLKALHEQLGHREFGKISQKILAIAYHRAGFWHVVERGVQGVDVDAADGREKYATEVKTTARDSVVFRQKDVEGLRSRCQDGYKPLLGVLRLSPLSEWYLVAVEEVRAGTLLIASLRPFRVRALEDRIQPHFDRAVEEHSEETLAGSQAYLDQVLRTMGIEVREQ